MWQTHEIMRREDTSATYLETQEGENLAALRTKIHGGATKRESKMSFVFKSDDDDYRPAPPCRLHTSRYSKRNT